MLAPWRHRPAGEAQAAPGVERLDVKAVNRKQDRSLYAAREKIYPKLAHGRFRTVKWLVMAVTLGIYYALPWLRWHRGPDLPDQAVLLDMAHNRFFFFFLEIWPQEFYFVTGLLVLARAGAVPRHVGGRARLVRLHLPADGVDRSDDRGRAVLAGRPQRAHAARQGALGPGQAVQEGHDAHFLARHRRRLPAAPSSSIFRDAPTLAAELLAGTAPTIAYLFLGIFALTTYVLGGIAREQVCIYMCPWPRIQGAMVDHETLLVTYKGYRGEPRGPHKKGQPWEGRGDCVDCKACVAVCPTGIDIRDGSQLECIQCALCIDACNDIMDKVDRPRGLIGYDTIAKQEAAAKGTNAPLRVVRARTLLYAGLICLVGAIMLAALLYRSTLDINVLHDRNPPFVLLSDGGIRNGYTVKILNKLHEPHEFTLEVRGLAGAQLAILGMQPGAKIRVTTDDLREVRVFVTVPRAELARLTEAVTPFALVVRDADLGHDTARTTRFQKAATEPGRGP